MTVNGTSVGSGTVPTSGSGTGNLTPSSTIQNLTGTITVVLTLSGASGTGTFRLDDFTLNGTVSSAASAPSVSTVAASGISATAATLNGNVTADGGASVTDRGVVYKTTAGAAIGDNKTAASTPTGTGAYSVNLSSLSVNQVYYFKAYAINSAGTTLGSELSFTTLANVPSAPTVANPGQTTLDVTVNVNGNPAATTFAIQADTNNDGSYEGYVQANGSVSASAVWQTAATWGTKTVTGLTPGQTAVFRVKARNGASVETAFGATASGTTSASCDAPTATTPSAAPSATVCAGTAITLTANQTGGTAPFNYQWRKNGSNIGGATASTYLIASPVHGDIYTCVMSAQCGGGSSTSPGVTLTVNQPPSSTITAPATVCASSAGNSASVPDAGGGASYSWSISGGSITAGSGTRTITFTAGASGTVTLNCTVTAATTCSSGGAQNTSVTITAPPTVTVNSPLACDGGSATVTATPAGGLAPYSYAWTVPGGANPGNVASFSATAAGVYSVIVTDSRGCASASGSGTLTQGSFSIALPPTIFSENMGTPSGTTAISANTFQNAELTFTGTGDCRTTTASSGYTGSSGNGNVFLTTTAERYFEIAGINTVGYTSLELSFGVYKSTTTGDGSDLAVEVSSDGVNYTALSFPAMPGTASWVLRTASGTIPATANLRIRFRQTGTARQFRIDDVKLTGTANEVTAAAITPESSTVICGGGSVILTASAGGSFYDWTVPVGATDPGDSANCTASVVGTYTVTITDANGCTSSDSETVTAAATPGVTLGANPTVCAGITSANLTYSGATGSPNQYSIDFNAAANTAGFVDVGVSALGASPIVLTVPDDAAAGTYSGTLTVYNSVSGCSSAGDAFSVIVGAAPSQPGAITQGSPSGSSVCAGAAGVTYAISAVSGATGYTWSVPAGASITAGQGTTQITVNWGSAASANVTVSAQNSCGVGTERSTTFTQVASVPGATTASEGSNVAPTSFNINWLQVAGATGYRIDVATLEDFSDGFVLQDHVISSGSTVTYLLTGLTSGMTYYYRVRAVNACGSGDNSETITVNTPLVIAGWDMSALPGGTANFGPSPMDPTMAAAGVTVGGLTRGDGVVTTGTAAAGGWGGAGWNYASAALAAAADRYATFTVQADAGNVLSLNNVSRLDYRRSGTGPSSGVLQYSLDGTSFTDITTLNYSSTASSGASIATPIDLTGIAALQNLDSSATVTFRIVNHSASDAGGTWYLHDTADTTANDLEIRGTLCAVPTVYNVTGGGARCSDGAGVAIGLSGSQAGITYQLYRNGGATTVGSPVSGTGSAISFGAKTDADTYTVVATRISGGCSIAMSGSATITINVTPSAPTGLTATPGVGEIGLEWTAPGGTVTGYNVKRSTTEGGPYSTLAAGANVSGTTFTDTTAQEGNSYYYVVSALNSSCEGANSGAANGALLGPLPDVPVAQAATSVGTTSFQANWLAADGAGSYRLDVSSESEFGDYVSGYQNLTVNNTLRSVTGLTPGQTYYYRVRAYNLSGASANSATITVILPATASIQVSEAAALGGGNASLAWSATPGVSYDVYKSETYPPSWTFLETVQAAGATVSRTVAEDDKRYFKVVLHGANVNTSPSQAYGVIKPTIPAGMSMLSPPLVGDLDLAGDYGAALAEVLPVGSKVWIMAPGAAPTWTERTLNGSGQWEYTSGANITELNRGQGFFVVNEGGSAQPRITGPVGNANTASIAIQSGYNILGLSEGKDLAAASAFESATPVGSYDQNSADQVMIQNADGSWRRLIRRPTGQWYDTGTRTWTTLTLTPGQAYYYIRVGDATAVTF